MMPSFRERWLLTYGRPFDNRLLVVAVRDFVDELRLTLVLGYAGRELSRERRSVFEHTVEIVAYADHPESRLHPHELVIDRSVLRAAAVNGHLESLELHDLLEPLLIDRLFRTHIDAHNQRAGELGFKAEDALAGVANLKAEVVEIDLVVHLFRAYGDDFQRVELRRVRSPDAEHGRSEDCLLEFLFVQFGLVYENIRRVVMDISLHSVHSLNPLKLRLERHRASVALHRTQAVEVHRLKILGRNEP